MLVGVNIIMMSDCRVYFVRYRVIGQRKVVFSYVSGLVIGVNVEDITQQIRKDCLGRECNISDNGNQHHEVAEDVIIDSVELVDYMMAITDNAMKVIKDSDTLDPDTAF